MHCCMFVVCIPTCICATHRTVLLQICTCNNCLLNGGVVISSSYVLRTPGLYVLGKMCMVDLVDPLRIRMQRECLSDRACCLVMSYCCRACRVQGICEPRMKVLTCTFDRPKYLANHPISFPTFSS